MFFALNFINSNFFIQYLLNQAVILTLLLICQFLFFNKIQISLLISCRTLSTLKFECNCTSISVEFKAVHFPVNSGVMFFQPQYPQYNLMISHINYIENDVLTMLLDSH